MSENTSESTEPLHIVSDSAVKQQVNSELIPSQSAAKEIPQIQSEALNFVNKICAMDLKELKQQLATVAEVEAIGVDLQKRAAQQSELLRQPIATLSSRAQDGGEVANALIDLKMTVESLDPTSINFEPGWFSRMLGFIPGVGNTLKRYVTKFESAKTVIAAIIRSLEQGRDQLLRDNITLTEDQKELWSLAKQLEQKILVTTVMDEELQKRSDDLQTDKVEQAKFIRENILFPLRQRLMDMQQQLAVQQQSIIATEIIIRNNKELVRGVNRALNVTVTALQCATTIAMALAHQQKVLDKVEKINETTSKLISGTAERLKTQGTQIHKQAASAQIDIQALKGALGNLNSALEDLSSFREKSLPQMSNSVKELNVLIAKTAEPLKRIEQLKESER